MASMDESLTGKIFKHAEKDFSGALQNAVDYRGDVTFRLQDGSLIEGYVFNQSSSDVSLFPKNSPRAISIPIKEIESMAFSGEDTASGKSWEDWVKKKEAEKSAIKAEPIQMV